MTSFSCRSHQASRYARHYESRLLNEQSTNYNLRGKHILELPKVNTITYGLKSWRYTAARIWNSLLDQFRAADKIGTFKNLMSMFDFSNFTF